jgi:hypothetical protein
MVMRVVVLMVVVVGFSLVRCAAFAPPFDKKDWPCGEPQMHWCQGHKSCCWDGEDCGGSVEFQGCPAGACCNARGLELGRQRDAGRD